jgi:hypothetical protein
MKVFESNYNRPNVEDRLSRLDILPGAEWTPRRPEEWWDMPGSYGSQGRISDGVPDGPLSGRGAQGRPLHRVVETSPYA